MSDSTSLTLLGKVQSGSEDAWETFDALYGPLIENWLRRQDVAGTVAQDIRQEAMLVVLREIKEFSHRGHRGAFRSWLRRVVQHQLQSYRRKKTPRLMGVHLDELAEQLADSDSQLVKQWDEEYNRQTVKRLLDIAGKKFEETTINVFRQVVLEQKNAAQVASDFGISPNAVYIARSRVFKELRNLGEGLFDWP